jgi:hypothetical protein
VTVKLVFLDVPKKATFFWRHKSKKEHSDILGGKKDFFGGLTQSFEYVPPMYHLIRKPIRVNPEF